jgi:hypothetical protein
MPSTRRLRPWTVLLGCLGTALAVAACTASSAVSSPPSVSYLASGPSAVTFVQWAATADGSIRGTLVVDAVSGLAPHETVSARSYPLTGHISRHSVTFAAAGSTDHGSVSGGVLTLASPLPGAVTGADRLTETAPTGYDQALAALRDRARQANGGNPSLAARLLAAYRATIQARHVLVRNLYTLRNDRRLARNDLLLTQTAEQTAISATATSHPVLACDDAVQVGLDAEYVADEATGMVSDLQTFRLDLPPLTDSRAALITALRNIARTGSAGQSATLGPAIAKAKNVRRSSRVFLARALSAANYDIRSVNRSVVAAYAESAVASWAGDCHSASAAPPPLPPVS